MATPIKVTLGIGTAILAPERPVHLDALLAWAAVDEAKAAASDSPFCAQEDLPLEKDDSGVWKASAFSWDAAKSEHFTASRTRSTDSDDMLRDIKKGVLKYRGKRILTSSGPLKQFLITEPLIAIREVYAYAMVTDIKRFETLLARLTGFGSTRGVGRGKIVAINLKEDLDAATNWEHRVLPYQKEGYAKVEAACRPPYWKSDNLQVAYEPMF